MTGRLSRQFKMNTVVKLITKQQVFPHCTPTHVTDSMTFPHTTSHISLKIPSVCNLLTTTYPQRSVSPWSAWRREASAARRSRRRLVCRRRQRSAGCGGCARTATWRLWVHGCSEVVPQRSSTPAFLLTHAAQSPEIANVCRRLASSAAAAASMSTWRRSTGQRSK